MGKITHVTLFYTDLSKLDEIPSEYLEPYLIAFLTAVIEGVGCGWTTPSQARADLMGLERFVSLFGGLHSRLATSNKYRDFCNMSDEDMIKICKETCENFG